MNNRSKTIILSIFQIVVVILTSISCQKDIAFTLETFTDYRDDNVYQMVTIGNQIWMAENLRYLPTVVGNGTGSKTSPYYYVYGYDGTNVTTAKSTANYSTYGVLYNWPAAMNEASSSNANPSEVQGVCPANWHLPSDAEWSELIDYLGGESTAGGKLKELGTTHWHNPNIAATNETKFSALPGGFLFSINLFLSIGNLGGWWSATEYDADCAWYRLIYNDYSDVYRFYDYSKALGFSVRCVKD